MIDFYAAMTPNAHKVTIMLEELGVPYTKHAVNLKELEQKTPEFLEKNPNGKIPVIVDHNGPDGKIMTVFESGAILYYLAEKAEGRFLGHTLDEKTHTMQWVMFQMSAIGPIYGNYNYGMHFMPEKVPQFIERFEKEAHRLNTVMNAQLTKHQYIAGDTYTIADMVLFPWVAALIKSTPEWFESTPGIRRWVELVGSRPAVQRAMP